MKSLRHAAALALVGWYLMAPSGDFVSDGAGGSLPAKMVRLGTFETEAQCDQALQAVKKRVAAAYSKQRKSSRYPTFQIGDAAECDDAKLAPTLSIWPGVKIK